MVTRSDLALGSGFGRFSADREGFKLEVGMRKLVIAVALGGAALATTANAQDAANGEKVFAQCRACHQIGPTAKNAVGPVLNGLFGRKSGTIEGYNYSAANKNSGITWDEAVFTEYIRDPKAKIPGTKMVFAGVKDEQRIKDLIAFLKQFDASGNKTSAQLGGPTTYASR
jgi:cytochrome c